MQAYGVHSWVRPVSFARKVAEKLGYDLRRLHKSDAMDHHLRRFFNHHGIELVIDCGAFIGSFGQKCRKTGYSGDIVSFEPGTKQFAGIARKVAGDSRWTAINAGLSDAAATGTMHVSSGPGDLNSLYAPRTEMFNRFGGLQTAAVESITLHRLEEFLAQRKVPPGLPLFLKSDTQGHDLSVLRGAGERLRDVEGILLEMSVQPLYEGTPSHWEVLDFLRTAGFEPYGFSSLSRDNQGGLIEYDALFNRRTA